MGVADHGPLDPGLYSQVLRELFGTDERQCGKDGRAVRRMVDVVVRTAQQSTMLILLKARIVCVKSLDFKIIIECFYY